MTVVSNDDFNFFMKSLPIEIGNKVFNYLMPSRGDHRKKMVLICKEIKTQYESVFNSRVLQWLLHSRLKFHTFEEFNKAKYA